MPGCKYKNINGFQYHIKGNHRTFHYHTRLAYLVSDEAALRGKPVQVSYGARPPPRHRKKGIWNAGMGTPRPPPIAPALVPTPTLVITRNRTATLSLPTPTLTQALQPTSAMGAPGIVDGVATLTSPPTSPQMQVAVAAMTRSHPATTRRVLFLLGSRCDQQDYSTPPTVVTFLVVVFHTHPSTQSLSTTTPTPSSPPATITPTTMFGAGSLPLSPTAPLRWHQPDPVVVAKRQGRLTKNWAAARLSRKRKMEHIERLTADKNDLRDRLTELDIEAAEARVERERVEREWRAQKEGREFGGDHRGEPGTEDAKNARIATAVGGM
ncbi:hypothetical protein BC938DRAFT_472775, partial [Jimgerdemannia flammicorona]